MKKKLLKILFIILCNLSVLIFLIFLLDIFIYSYYCAKLMPNVFNKTKPKFSYILEPYKGQNNYYKNYFSGDDNIFRGRKPDGLEYIGKSPIVVFGCSYAHGQFLNYNQTFSYKLAHILKRPVYNRAVPGQGVQFLYYQSINKDFYNSVPPSDNVIYVIFHHHYKRLFLNYLDVLSLYRTIQFNIKGDKLVLDEKNYLKNLIISSYTFKLLQEKYVDSYLYNPKNEEEITDLMLFYFVKSRENLEREWNRKINFTVVFYNDTELLYKNTLFKKLRENNFKVIETDKISDIDLNSVEYRNLSNNHPTEKVWDVLTPIIAKELY